MANIEEIREFMLAHFPGLKERLEKIGYFTAPASTNHHNNFPGGLAEHSDGVYKIFNMLIKYIEKSKGISILSDTEIYTTAMLHDLDKATMYEPNMIKSKKKVGGVYPMVVSEKKPYAVIKGSYPHTGHFAAEKASKMVSLTDEQEVMIRAHNGPFEFDFRTMESYYKKRSPWALLLFLADYMSTMMEDNTKKKEAI